MNVRENRRGKRRIENPVPLAKLGTRHRTKTNKTQKKTKKKNKKQKTTTHRTAQRTKKR
jgi:hypothetical protein